MKNVCGWINATESFLEILWNASHVAIPIIFKKSLELYDRHFIYADGVRMISVKYVHAFVSTRLDRFILWHTEVVALIAVGCYDSWGC